MARVRLRRGELDGLDLHYTSTGNGPVTILIHGLGGFAESWRGTQAALESHSRIVALDLPGFGQSSKPRRAYTLAFFAQAVEGLLEELGIERVRLVGHSLGAGVALAISLRQPERVERLALIGAAVPGFPLRPSALFRLMAAPGVGEVLSSFVTPRVCLAALGRCLVVPQPEEVTFLVEHQYAVRTTPEGRAAYLATLRGIKEDFTGQASRYRAAFAGWNRPTLIIHGRQDPVVPFQHAEAAAKGIRRAEARWLDRCGHFPQIEHGGAVNGWIGEFLLAGTVCR
jgi:pimeloyl-ACP methyl ester carboxylesterase